MTILLLEDEPIVAESLKKQVAALVPDAMIHGPLATVSEARTFLATSKPDLILSDIQLADGNSLQLFTEHHVNCPVIFTTAYNEYAVRAFKVNSIDYLLKPVDKEELRAAFEKFRRQRAQMGDTHFLEHLSELLSGMGRGARFKERFAVHSGRNVVLVKSEDIAFFSKEELIFLHSREERKYITDYRSLDEVAELVDPARFYRANRQCLVNISYISSMRSDDAGRVHVLLSVKSPEIIVSKERASSFRKWVEG